jgi:ABC-type multidrug transport system ATPase subunit/ABC-type multidrug transport system permease subunit
MELSFLDILASTKKTKCSNLSKTILHNVSGSCKTNELNAFLGPSGSGKTTLLNIIGGRLSNSSFDISGNVTYNNQIIDRHFRKNIGFVTQEELFYKSLTVYETLMYYSLLKLPSELPKKDKLEIANKTITDLGLDKCRDTIIGDSFGIRGISGGEKKRLSVATEILSSPLILILDEPTSGLDSTAALSLITQLKIICSKGDKIVLASIHQPPSRVFHMLDQIFLLSDGHLMYNGKRDNISNYFEQHGYVEKFGVNEADFILDLASGIYNENEFDKKELYMDTDIEYQPRTDKMTTSVKRIGASYPQQIMILLSRALKTRKADTMDKLDFLQTLVIAIFSGMFWFRSTTMIDIQGFLFFELMFVSFRALFTALVTFPSEYKISTKERRSGMYNLSAFYISRTASDIPIDLAMPTIMIFITYFMVGLKATAAAFFANWFTGLLVVLVAQSHGLLIGSAITTPKTAQTTTTIVVLLMMLSGGFYVTQIPVWIAWFKYCSFVYYGYNMFNIIQFGNQLISGSIVLDVSILIIILIILRIATYMVLRYKGK